MHVLLNRTYIVFLTDQQHGWGVIIWGLRYWLTLQIWSLVCGPKLGMPQNQQKERWGPERAADLACDLHLVPITVSSDPARSESWALPGGGGRHPQGPGKYFTRNKYILNYWVICSQKLQLWAKGYIRKPACRDWRSQCWKVCPTGHHACRQELVRIMREAGIHKLSLVLDVLCHAHIRHPQASTPTLSSPLVLRALSWEVEF